mmetsp:Transcript_4474/g.6322  ORF Transcript_4474/g.6322 Transcript_4474/m.6322 type:complete len:643 (-) Transcript_4474:12-1940(-)
MIVSEILIWTCWSIIIYRIIIRTKVQAEVGVYTPSPFPPILSTLSSACTNLLENKGSSSSELLDGEWCSAAAAAAVTLEVVEDDDIRKLDVTHILNLFLKQKKGEYDNYHDIDDSHNHDMDDSKDIVSLLDKDEDCDEFALDGACHYEPDFMLENCIISCLTHSYNTLGSLGYFVLDDQEEMENEEDIENEGEIENDNYHHDEKSEAGHGDDDDGDNDKDDDLNCVDIHKAGDSYEFEDENKEKLGEKELFEFSCEEYSKMGYCTSQHDSMRLICAQTCLICIPNHHISFRIGVPQRIISRNVDIIHETLNVIINSHFYMRTIMTQEEYAPIRTACQNTHELCSHWAALQMCTEYDTQSFMTEQCGPACNTCDHLIPRIECPYDEDFDLWKPGDLNQMFENILTQHANSHHFNITIHSRPTTTTTSTSTSTNNKNNIDNIANSTNFHANTNVKSPWLITIDDFLSIEECDTFKLFGTNLGFAASTLQQEGFDSEYRTSATAWCDSECDSHPITKRIQQRISNLTGIPQSHSEPLQFLKYLPQQFYKRHNDYNFLTRYQAMGPRILTFFIYLNDVQEGGDTHFNDIALNITPRRGMAVVWPSVLDDNPNEMDSNTFHEAMPVLRGEKYGVNAWFHLRSFVTEC